MPRPASNTVAFHRGCAYSVTDCTYGNCKPSDLCPAGRPVMRNKWAGGGGHHHANQHIPEDELTRKKGVSGLKPDAIVKDEIADWSGTGNHAGDV